MRLSTTLMSAAALALAITGPAAAADFLVSADANANVFANTNCDTPTGSISGHSPVSILRTCDRPGGLGSGVGAAFASFGHLGVDAIASSNADSLGSGMSTQADFKDVVFFSQTNGGNATTMDVSVNLILDGLLLAQAADSLRGGAAARVEGFAILNTHVFNFVYERFSDGTSDGLNSFITSGDLLADGRVTMRSPTVTVSLNTPTQFRLHLENAVGTGGFDAFGGSDFDESSFKLPTNGPAFNLADGFTVNAGDWLVDNHFIDPLAVGGVPEPTAWALMIAGLGMAGSSLRRRRQARQA